MTKKIKEVEFVVYKMQNIKNGKIYIGQTKNFLLRMRRHRYEAKRGLVEFPIYRAINKYGIENFDISIVELCDSVDRMNEREIYWIKFYNSQSFDNGYNVMSGGCNRDISYEINKKKQEKMYCNPPRNKRFKYLIKVADGGHYAAIQVYGKREKCGPFRTECEAAWSADLMVRKNISSDVGAYLNFPDGKTEELIREQLASKRMVETITYIHMPPQYIKDRDRWSVRVKRISDSKVTNIGYGSKELCDEVLNEFIYKHKSIVRTLNSLIRTQIEYELLHGSIYDLISDEELETAYALELGSFE